MHRRGADPIGPPRAVMRISAGGGLSEWGLAIVARATANNRPDALCEAEDLALLRLDQQLAEAPAARQVDPALDTGTLKVRSRRARGEAERRDAGDQRAEHCVEGVV